MPLPPRPLPLPPTPLPPPTPPPPPPLRAGPQTSALSSFAMVSRKKPPTSAPSEMLRAAITAAKEGMSVVITCHGTKRKKRGRNHEGAGGNQGLREVKNKAYTRQAVVCVAFTRHVRTQRFGYCTAYTILREIELCPHLTEHTV